MVVTSEVLAAGWIRVQWKPEWIKSFKSRFKNRQRVADQRDSAENRKAPLEELVLVNGWTSNGMADECKVWMQTRSMFLSCR